MANGGVFAENLNRICKEKGTTITTILKELGLSTSKVTLWNNGSLPKLDVIRQLADHLNCNASDFFRYPSEDEKKQADEFHDLTEQVREVTHNLNTPREMFKGTDQQFQEFLRDNSSRCDLLINKLDKFRTDVKEVVTVPVAQPGMESELVEIFRGLSKSQQYKLMSVVYEFVDDK